MDGRCPVDFKDLGRWWGTDPAARSQTEIDIMGEQDRENALFGECKWTNSKVDTGVLDTLEYRSQLFTYKNTRLFLFSKAGFTAGCRQKASVMGNVELITYEDIVKDI